MSCPARIWSSCSIRRFRPANQPSMKPIDTKVTRRITVPRSGRPPTGSRIEHDRSRTEPVAPNPASAPTSGRVATAVAAIER